MNKIIFFVAGGTGGHLFPAIAVAKSFEKSQSHFLVDKRTEKILLYWIKTLNIMLFRLVN